jgi:Cu(I)/Ag(I) efflux system periplasmic protein CusF
MKLLNLLGATLLTISSFAHAQSQPAPAPAPSSAPATSPMSEGEVRKVDKDAGKVTLRHGPLVNLDMPPMTMVFRVSDPKMLDGLKDGDKVRFNVERANGAFTVTKIEPAK